MLSKQVAAATSELALSDVGFSMEAAKLAPRATASGSAATIAAALPRADSGPFEVTHTSYTVASQDCSDRTVDVYTPAVPAGRSVPLISYAHGLFGGGGVDWSGYLIPLSAVASYGFVVAATRACNVGCKEQRNCKSVRGECLPVALPGVHYGSRSPTRARSVASARKVIRPALATTTGSRLACSSGHRMRAARAGPPTAPSLPSTTRWDTGWRATRWEGRS